jgi:hypothetical protein
VLLEEELRLHLEEQKTWECHRNRNDPTFRVMSDQLSLEELAEIWLILYWIPQVPETVLTSHPVPHCEDD